MSDLNKSQEKCIDEHKKRVAKAKEKIQQENAAVPPGRTSDPPKSGGGGPPTSKRSGRRIKKTPQVEKVLEVVGSGMQTVASPFVWSYKNGVLPVVVGAGEMLRHVPLPGFVQGY